MIPHQFECIASLAGTNAAQLPCWPLANADIDRAKMEFEIYPNPTSRLLYIIPESKAEKELYNSVG